MMGVSNHSLYFDRSCDRDGLPYNQHASPFTNPETPPIVDLSHIVRRFGDRTVLDDISLRVERGELFGLLGPSGSGKTTLIKLITGIDRADKGSVRMLGEAMPKLSMLQRFGYMAQSDALYNELTAQENLTFFCFSLRIKRIS